MYRNSFDTLVFQWIDVRLGLHYLNNNMKLYLNVLENFFNRYKALVIKELSEEALKSNVHSIKGLSSTLGMVALAKASTELHESFESINLMAFEKTFYSTIDELQTLVHLDDSRGNASDTLLILEDDVDFIDEIIELLDDTYDILVALESGSAFEIFHQEDIGLLITTDSFVARSNLSILEEEVLASSAVCVVKSFEEVPKVQSNRCYITRPFYQDELKECLKIQIKINNII